MKVLLIIILLYPSSCTKVNVKGKVGSDEGSFISIKERGEEMRETKRVFLKKMKGDNWKVGTLSNDILVWSYSSYPSRSEAQKAAMNKYKNQAIKFSVYREE
jgi:hypothetical protein